MNYAEIIASQRTFFDGEHTFLEEHRFGVLALLRNTILARKDDICEALYQDFGKPVFESYETEILPVLHELKLMMRNLKKWMKPKYVRTSLFAFPGKGKMYAEPYGTVLIVSPWNYPFLLTMMPLIGALAGGNTAIIIPSIHTTYTSQLIFDMIDEVFEPSYVKVLLSDEYILEDVMQERFDKVFFTGSPEIGRMVMTLAAQHLTPVTLELGGKSPAILDKTADISLAAEKIVWGKFLNAGQTCVAPDYVLVPKEKQEELLAAMKSCIRSFYGERPLESDSLASIIHERAFERLITALEGEQIYCGGASQKGALRIEPTIVVDSALDSSFMKEEIFGPILPVIGVENLGEALEIVKNKEKPLALYFFSQNRKAIDYVLETIPFGGGCVNDTVMHLMSGMPFGGIGQSGIGQYFGKASFDIFTHQKFVLVKKKGIRIKKILPPYNDEKLQFIQKILK